MTDSLNEQVRDARRSPAPDEAHRLTFHVSPEHELAQLRPEVKPPDLPGSQSSSRRAHATPEAATQRGLPPHQFMSARRFREESGRPAPYSEGKRLGYGLLWSGWTLLLVIAGFSLLPHGSTVFSGLLAFALAIITGRYAYRIWTWQAKRLIFFIIW
jgi:hypothetical protein